MITKEEFSKLMTIELDMLQKQTSGLSHADSLLQPQPGGNCLNWIMGHLLVNLVDILNVLGAGPPAVQPDLSHYGYGSEPVRCDAPGVIELQDLVETYALLTNAITDQLTLMTAADFDEVIDFWQGKSRRGYVAFFYFFHNPYHIGQLEQLRHLAGRTEKVI